MKKVLLENESAKFELEEGIIIANWNVSQVDLQIAQKLVAYRIKATEGKTYPMLVNIISVKDSEKEARDFLASEKGCEGIIALALLINSPIGSMIGNFWMRINKPLVPTQLFTNEMQAKKWLAQYVK